MTHKVIIEVEDIQHNQFAKVGIKINGFGYLVYPIKKKIIEELKKMME